MVDPPPGRVVRVEAPCRLHFGMFAFGLPGERQFGGAGVMVSPGALRLEVQVAPVFEAHGPLAKRAAEFAHQFAAEQSMPLPPVRIDVLAMPAAHVGLGSGTQLGLAVATALDAFLRSSSRSAVQSHGHRQSHTMRTAPWRGQWHTLKALSELGLVRDPVTLAPLVGRGCRSAIGVHGFAHGGLIVESGKGAPHEISPLTARVEMPRDWRFVLLRPRGQVGVSGDAERKAFEQMPPIPAEVTRQLLHESLERLAPAARAADFEAFSESLYRLGHQAGLCFAANQGGVFATPRLAGLIEQMRSMGIRGVGQSSWGPTLFALMPSESKAVQFKQQMQATSNNADLHLSVVEIDHRGAVVRVDDDAPRT